jgi:hypothetical protein
MLIALLHLILIAVLAITVSSGSKDVNFEAAHPVECAADQGQPINYQCEQQPQPPSCYSRSHTVVPAGAFCIG